jgi:hypothetical protein
MKTAKQMLIHVLIACALVRNAAGADYPSTYPFQDESYVPPMDLPDSTPDLTFEPDSDPGGYYITYAINKNFDDQTDGPPYYALPYFNFAEYFCWHTWDIKCSENGWAFWNCTAKGIVFEEADYPGTVVGETICEDCCSEWMGYPKQTTDQLDRQATWDTFIQANACETYHEALYCHLSDGWHGHVCLEQYIDQGTRQIYKPCLDNGVRWMLECNLLKTTGAYSYIEVYEPNAYRESLSIEQTFIVYYIQSASGHDRVCYPYSYYFPDASAEADDSGSLAPVVVLSSILSTLL